MYTNWDKNESTTRDLITLVILAFVYHGSMVKQLAQKHSIICSLKADWYISRSGWREVWGGG